MARGIFHRAVTYRPKRSKLCYEIGASSRIQIVKRDILTYAVSIGAAIELPTNYAPRHSDGGPEHGARTN
jgi:hypothetical protein